MSPPPPQIIHNRPRYFRSHVPRYGYNYNLDYPRYNWYNRWNRPIYVLTESKKEEMNYMPLVLIGGISILALVLALQKR